MKLYGGGMVRCKSFSSSTVLVELHRIGIVGLRKALEETDNSGLDDQKAKLDHLIKLLSVDNFIPRSKIKSYQTTLWREYLRYKGENFSDYYSDVCVTIRGEEDEVPDRFVKTLRSVFAYYELNPVITYAPPSSRGNNPQLVIEGNTIVEGDVDWHWFKDAVKRNISDW